MAEPYLTKLKSFVEMSCAQREDAANILCKHFFSGAAACADGQIFMTLTPMGLALKLSEDDRTALFNQGAQHLQYFPKAPVKKDYVVLPVQAVDDDATLSDWISRSIEFVGK